MATHALRFVPFLRMLALNGSLVRGEEKVESDIDFLIVAKRNRLYTARFVATILTELTGYRRKADKVAGRICLNCYLPDNNLKIAPVSPDSRKKVATAYKYLIATIDDGGFEQKFIDTNEWFGDFRVFGKKYNQSLRKRLLYILAGRVSRAYFISPKIARALKPKKWGEGMLSGKFGDYIEKRLMNFQKNRILAGKKRGDEIVCKKNEIRLHPKKINS